MNDRPEALAAETVERFVRACHSDEDQVKQMLSEHPGLANATWDWGGGDYESALGAAAHSGQRAIAELLLDHGARLDVPAAAMLGHRAVVEAYLREIPTERQAPGAHGIPLLAHARIGGQEEIATLIEQHAKGDAEG